MHPALLVKYTNTTVVRTEVIAFFCLLVIREKAGVWLGSRVQLHYSVNGIKDCNLWSQTRFVENVKMAFL